MVGRCRGGSREGTEGDRDTFNLRVFNPLGSVRDTFEAQTVAKRKVSIELVLWTSLTVS